MSRRKTTRYHFPQIKLPGIKLPKANLPKVDLPKLNLPHIKLPQVRIPVRQILVVAIMGVLVLTMMNLNTRLMDYYRLSSERDTIQTQVAQLQSTQQVLQTQMAYAQSNSAVEGFARDSHMVREGEKLVVVLTPQDNVITTPESPVSTPKPVENWEVWWALFFGN